MAPLVEQWSLSVFLRVAVMLLPAFYCSWTAFCLTLKITAAADNKVVWAVTTTTTEFTIGTRSSAPLLQAPTRRTVVVVAEENQTDSRTQEIADAAINSAASKCFPFNSVEWLAGPRQGNSDNGGDNLLERIVGNGRFSPASGSSLLRPILEQSVCGSQSPFLGNSLHRTINQGLTTPQENAAVRLWTARLLYLVVYEHQHRPAVLEAEQRKKKEYIQHLCPHAAKDYGIGAFDFECPSAQFLVVSFYHNGIGANLRLAAVPALMVGIATGRVVLFVNHATKGPAFLREPWTLASCDHRRDSQCFFRPASPCVLTEAELDTAYTLQRSEMRRFVRFGQMPEKHADDRVLILHLSFRPQRQPENLRTVLYNRTTALIDRLVVADNLLPSALLYKAADAILVGDEPPVTNFNYYGAGSQIFHSLLLYAMRPNARAAAQMDAILQEVLPTNFVADEALGLPIRGMCFQ